MLDVSNLVARYAQLESHDLAIEHVFDALLQLRRCILDTEDPRFDNPVTQGLRYHFGVVELADSSSRPVGLELVDRERGVVSLFDLPFKVYRPRANGQPGPNKTTVAIAERAAIEEQLPLFDHEQLSPGLTNMLLRVEVDIDGEPVSLYWEEWEGKKFLWSAEIFRSDSDAAPLVPLGDNDLPPPADPSRDSVGLPQDVVEGGPDDDDGSP